MKLEDIHKENIFKVPDNYFEDLPGRLEQRIAEDRKSIKLIPVRKIINWAAAAAILVFGLYGITRLGDQPLTVDQILSEVPTEELIDYLVESDMSTEELLENIDISIIANNDDPLPDDLISTEPIDEKTIDELLDEYQIENEYM